MQEQSISGKIRIYGQEPYHVVAIHGGPGAAGSMAPVCTELSKRFGVLEPFQTGMNIGEQVQELKEVLATYGELPVTLIGHSWGAWLGFIFAAKHPSLVKKLVMIDAGPFCDDYVPVMNETRWTRLNEAERKRVDQLTTTLVNASGDQQKVIFEEFGSLMSRVDSFDPAFKSDEQVDFRSDIFNSVMPEAAALRSSGELLAMGRYIVCPVTAIHGDYDPHPAVGVQEPLTDVVKDFRFILLERCGHQPWEERYAREAFFQTLLNEVG